MKVWQLQEAKAQLSKVVRLCMAKKPQIISVHGKEEIIMMALDDYKKLVSKKPSFIEFMKKSPLKGVKLDLERDKSLPRDIDL